MSQSNKTFEKIANMIGGECVTYVSTDALADVRDRMHWEDAGDLYRDVRSAGLALDVIEDEDGVPVAWRMDWMDEDVDWPNADTRQTWHVCDGQDYTRRAIESVGGRVWDTEAVDRALKYSHVWG